MARRNRFPSLGRIGLIGWVWLLVAAGAWAQPQPPGSAEQARLVEKTGVVEISRDGGNSYRPAAEKQRLEERDWIRCGRDSTAKIDLGNERIVAVSAETTLELAELRKLARRAGNVTRLDLKEGEVFSAVKALKKRGDRYEVRTPTATAAVRGTRFVVRYSDRPPRRRGDFATTVVVLEGVVAVLDRMGREVGVLDNEKMMAIDQLGAGAVESAPPTEVQNLEESFESFEMAAAETGAAPGVEGGVVEQVGQVG
ncbi:FecR domain-containing protein [bacterium]|nr:FecR domain-containing protein [bacterium]